MSKLLCLFLIFALTEAASIPANTIRFRDDYTYLSKYEAFYKVHKTRMTFNHALATCAAEGAVLLVPNSMDEITDVQDLMTIVDSLWIGMHDLYGKGLFVTVDDGRNVDNAYTNWSPNEPNNSGGNENCVMTNKDALYNDIDCKTYARFACKRIQTANTTMNDACNTYDLQYVYEKDFNACYKMHTTPLSWKDAFKTCMREGGTLAIINSPGEAKYLTEQFKKYPENELTGNFDKSLIHLGFSDIINEGIYITIDGKSLAEAGYTEWASGQPDNYNDKENCGSMTRSGELNDFACDKRAMFVCERKMLFSIDIRMTR